MLRMVLAAVSDAKVMPYDAAYKAPVGGDPGRNEE